MTNPSGKELPHLFLAKSSETDCGFDAMVLNQSDEATQVGESLRGFGGFRTFSDFSATERPPSIFRNPPKQFSCFQSMERVCTPFLASSMYLAVRDNYG